MLHSAASLNENSDGAALRLTVRKGPARAFSAVAWGSFVFAILQSVCTVLIGLGGARLLISLLSLAAASSVIAHIDAFHRDVLRIPMMLFASAGAILNWIVIMQIRRLRHRPAARWRLDPSLEGSKLKWERWQIVLSIATVALVISEELMHHGHVHHW
jgi:hypothetical protein